jgi:hypothetical protein
MKVLMEEFHKRKKLELLMIKKMSMTLLRETMTENYRLHNLDLNPQLPVELEELQ